MARIRTAALIALVLATPVAALAQQGVTKGTASEHYIVLDTRTKRCSIVDRAPLVDSPAITLASDAIYATRAEAEEAMKTLKPCVAP